VQSAGGEVIDALSTLRHCYLPRAGLGDNVALWVSENGYATNLGRSEASQEADLSATVRELPKVLEAARPALDNLNAAFPSTRAWAREMIPGVRETPATLDAGFPWVRQARALLRKSDHYEVIETEGGHIDFAPLDLLEDKILTQLRRHFRRVSVERVAAGQGLWNLYEALGAIEGLDLKFHDEKELWVAALEGSDSLATAALDRLCLSLGAVAGDLSLAQGANGVVIAGGVGLRLADYLPRSGFRDRFIAKGRFERRMDEMPVKLISHPQPGLFGAAAAFAREYA